MDTEAIRSQTAVVDAARKAVADSKTLIAKVSARHGQDCAVIHINGVKFDLTSLNRAYMPEVIKGMEAIQRECVAMLQAQLATHRSRLEGAEWKLLQLVKSP